MLVVVVTGPVNVDVVDVGEAVGLGVIVTDDISQDFELGAEAGELARGESSKNLNSNHW